MTQNVSLEQVILSGLQKNHASFQKSSEGKGFSGIEGYLPKKNSNEEAYVNLVFINEAEKATKACVEKITAHNAAQNMYTVFVANAFNFDKLPNYFLSDKDLAANEEEFHPHDEKIEDMKYAGNSHLIAYEEEPKTRVVTVATKKGFEYRSLVTPVNKEGEMRPDIPHVKNRGTNSGYESSFCLIEDDDMSKPALMVEQGENYQ